MQILDEERPAGAAADLIALDSPFMSEPAAAPSIVSALSGVVEPHFEATWAALGDGAVRGWCEASMDTVLRRLQSLQRRLRVMERDRAPFEGRLAWMFFQGSVCSVLTHMQAT